MSIFPYVYYMVQSFDKTLDAQKIAIYAGMVTSSFAFAEFSTGVVWGRISDRVGRKPVLIMGLVGTALSMIVFGFAPNMCTALIARALGGLLNGNVGVLQTTVAEIITVKEHQPRAYSIMPFVWCLGSIIGPAMGGALAQPCLSYPWLFPKNTLFDRYPFLLPNLVCTVVLAFGITIGILFLEETHAEKRHNRDYGLEAGKWLLARLFRHKDVLVVDAKIDSHHVPLVEDEQPPGYRTTEASPRISSLSTPALVARDTESGLQEKSSRGITRAFNRQVIVIIIGYGLLA